MLKPAPLDLPHEAVDRHALLAAIMESSDDAIVSKTLDGIITSWNPGAQKMFGYTMAETVGRPVLMLIPPDRQHEEEAILARLRRGERVEHYETERRDKSGRIFPVSLTFTPLRDARGAVVGACKIARLAGAYDHDAQRLLAAIVESSDDAIISKDLDGTITSWNHGAELIFGYRAIEAIGRSILLIIPPERTAEESFILAKVRQGERVDHIETIRRRSDGVLIEVSVTVSPVRDMRGRIIGASKIARDISRRRTEEKIKAALEEKEMLLKEIHHRVKNNLQITSSLLKLQSEYVRDPRTLELFLESEHRIRSMGLVHEKLYLAPDVSRIDLLDYATSLATLLGRAFGAADRGVEITVAGSPAQVTIELAVPCGLILNELISNSLKHAFTGRATGRIEVWIGGESGATVIRVADDGQGLPEGFSLERSSTLGLELVQTLTRQLRGTLHVRPRGPTEFELRFTNV